MNRSPTQLLFVSLFAWGIAGCSGTSPSPPTYSLTGIVSELTDTGSTPVGGAQVSEARNGRSAFTDTNGVYSLSVLTTSNNTISVKKEGFFNKTVLQTSMAQLDVRLERIPPYTLAGTVPVLSGVVFETTDAGRVPLEGVTLYCDSCGSPVGHTFVDTDAEGFYKFEWSPDGVHPLYVWKTGYGIRDQKLLDGFGRIGATVRGDTRFDIEMERR